MSLSDGRRGLHGIVNQLCESERHTLVADVPHPTDEGVAHHQIPPAALRFERLDEVPGFEHRIRVRPGLTGLAQVYARRDVPRRQKFKYDRLYVERRSWCLDVRLILLSFWISLLGTWEARGRKY